MGSTYFRCKAYNPNDINTVVVNFYQIGPISIRLNALIDLLMLVAEEPLFDILRTKEQLGYDVACGIRDNQGILGYTITVNSQESKFTVDHVDERIEHFRGELINIIANLSNEDFEQYKDSLVQMKLTDDNDLKDEIDRNWGEVTADDYHFERAQLEADELKTITHAEFLAFYRSSYGAGNERKLSTQIIGNPNGNKDDADDMAIDKSTFDRYEIVEFPAGKVAGVLIRDLDEYKQSLEIYPISKTIVVKEKKV